ncbi:AmmeMemoRadiSam system radical SAM enzyme [Halosegnis longus]|uniref:AmmeMemoRadiSam system radical SAM enzyme n=1 Tax=Halosegnis longus TaxID=2216012 RepID=UPI001562E87D|nr:AmmeMemoRadiSam system radical SAM enzyme [Halosegnis longus]
MSTSPREVRSYDRRDGTVQCHDCPRECAIPDGETGACDVRVNDGGTLLLDSYGKAVATAVDPIEKKPLFHVAPGARLLSLAAKGCTFACEFCQNYEIALEHEGVPERDRPPETLATTVEDRGLDGIAYTYTEPTAFLEYALDTMDAAPDDALQVFVSNGYMTPETVDALAPRLDAINIDIKGDETFYREHIGAPDPEPIYDAVERFADRGVHVEVTNLIVPGYNDDEQTIRERMAWLHDAVGPETPVHFSRFRPAYQFRGVQPTPVETLERAMAIAREEGLAFVYCGNVSGHEAESTYCPECGRVLVRREGFTVESVTLGDGACPCGYEPPLVGTAREASPRRPFTA